MAMMVTGFLGWQVYLMTTNQTSIEFHNNSEITSKLQYRQRHNSNNSGNGSRGVSFKHIYRVGVFDNVANFLGSDPWYWLLPTKFEGCDGIHFKTVAAADIQKFQAYSTEAQLESDGESDDESPIMQYNNNNGNNNNNNDAYSSDEDA